MTRKCVRTQTE